MKKIAKAAIANSFMQLCLEIPVKRITIKHIIDACEISKQTFYNYFLDKQDLMNYIYAVDSKLAADKHYNLNAGPLKTIETAFEKCLEKKSYYLAIANYDTQNGFPQYFYQNAIEFYTALIIDNYGKEALTAPIKHAIEFNCAGAEKLFVDWIKRGMVESPRMIATELVNCMPVGLKKYVYRDSEVE